MSVAGVSAANDPEAVARAAGYDWGEIDDHLQGASTEAADAGFSERDIDQYLGFDPDVVEGRASDLYNTSALTSPRDIDKIDVRGTYADLLRSNSVRSARAFTGALGAMPLSEEGGPAFDDVVERADALNAGLPSRRSFIDASLALANDRNYDIVRGNLIDHWWETGQAPGDAADEASQDGELHARLTTPPRGLLSEFYHATGRGLGELYYGIHGIAQLIENGMSKIGVLSPETAKADADELRHQIEQFHKNWAPSRDDFAGSMVNLLGDGGATIGSLMAFGGVNELVGYGALHGADAAWNDTHSLSGAVVGATVGAAEMGLPLKLLHGPEGAGIIRSAVSGALKMGGAGGLSMLLDPLPRFAAGEGYQAPSWSDIGHGIETGAFMGALGGAIARARNPQVRQIQPDGTAETVPLRELPEANQDLHEAAAEEVARPSSEVQLGKMEPRETFAGGGFESWPILGVNGERLANIAIEREGDVAHISAIGPEKETAGGFTVTDVSDQSLSNAIGPRAMRSLARQYFEANPDINRIDGFRMGGARGIKNAAEVSITREQIMGKPGEAKPAPGTPEPLTPLEENYRAAAALHQFLDSSIPGGLKALFADQEGALKLPTSGDKYDTALNIIRITAENKDLGRAGWANLIEPFFRQIEPDFREYLKLKKAGDIQGMLNSKIGLLKRYMDGEQGVDLHPDHDAIGIAKQIRQLNLFTRAHIEAADPETKRDFVENYMRRVYIDKRNPDNWYGSFLHARSLEHWRDAILSGKEDAIEHPLENALFDLGQKLSFVMRMKAQDQLTKAGLLKWATEYPGGDWKIIPGMTKRAPVTYSPETQKVRDAQAQAEAQAGVLGGSRPMPVEEVSRIDTNTGGVLQAYANEEVGTLLSEWAKAFQHIPQDSPRLALFRQIGNKLQQINLFGPLFHGVTELAHMSGGVVGETGRFLGNVLTHPTEVGTLRELPRVLAKAVQGHKLREAMYEYGRALPDDQQQMLANNPVLRMAVEGAFRPSGRQDIYRPSAATPFLTAIKRGTYTRELGQRLRDGLSGPAYKLPFIAADELARPLFDLAAPFWDTAIPWMKSSQVLMQIEGWLARNPNASDAERMIAARQISDNVDDRMGEMNMNNVIMRHYVRAVSSTSMISLSWFYGTVRQTAAAIGLRLRTVGGGPFTVEFNPAALGNLAGLLVVQAGLNALYQYMKTGKMPGEDEDYYPDEAIPPWVRDLVAPRTGGVTKGGAQARTLLPGEVKEFYDWGKIVATALARLRAPHGGTEPALQALGEGLGTYATAKLRNIVRIPLAMASGFDAVGHPIGYGQYTWEWYLLHNVMPIVISNWEQTRPKANIATWESMLGLREMPDWLSDPVRFQHTQNFLAQRNWSQAIRRAAQERQWNSPQ